MLARCSAPASTTRLKAPSVAVGTWSKQGLRRSLTSWVSLVETTAAAMLLLRRSLEMMLGAQLRRGFQALWVSRGERRDARERPLRHWSRRQLSAAWGSWESRAVELMHARALWAVFSIPN